MADRIVIMKDGHIQQVGTPNDVYHNPANTFVARFIGAPSMNLLDATATKEGVRLSNGLDVALRVPDTPPGTAVTLGVRPDDLTPDGPLPLIEGTVAVQEPLGAETLIYVTVGAQEVIAKASGRTPPNIGSTVKLGAASENLHVFDAKTGLALT